MVLILEKDGHWHTRQQGGVEVNVFYHAKSKFKLTWWSSTGTFTVQGSEKICHDIVKKVQHLVDDKAENSVKTGETTKAGKQKRENPTKLDEIELKVNEFQSDFGDELKKMWSAIESIQRALTHASKTECKQKDALSFPNVSTSNRFPDLIETTPSEIEKNDDNRFAGSSNNNNEEIEKLKKAAMESKKKVDELERKLKDKETITKMLKTDCERLKTEKVKVRSEDMSSTKRGTNLSWNNQENVKKKEKNTGVTNKNVSASEKAENHSTEKNNKIIKRDDYLSSEGQEVNRILSTILPEQVSLISHYNISEQHLNHSGLHLNKRGTGALAYNIIHYVKTLNFKNSCI